MSIVVPPSGYFLANRLARTLLSALEEAVGRNGLNALMNLSQLGNYIDEPPPNDVALGFDIAGVSSLNSALEMVYGPRGGRGMGLRAGRAMYGKLVDAFDLPTGFNELAFRLLPLQTRLRIGVPALARLFTQHSDVNCRVTDRGSYYEYSVERCPACWGRKSKVAVCYLLVGLLQEAASAFGRGQEFRVIEVECRALAAEGCVFHIEKEPIA